ncbi:hypothetical protein GW17_00047545 [Ensete ventricosum]|nr:hypothetical protein GW17_00047545 [Ensete ventricosum]
MKRREAEEKRACPSLMDKLEVVPTDPGVSSIGRRRGAQAHQMVPLPEANQITKMEEGRRGDALDERRWEKAEAFLLVVFASNADTATWHFVVGRRWRRDRGMITLRNHHVAFTCTYLEGPTTTKWLGVERPSGAREKSKWVPHRPRPDVARRPPPADQSGPPSDPSHQFVTLLEQRGAQLGPAARCGRECGGGNEWRGKGRLPLSVLTEVRGIANSKDSEFIQGLVHGQRSVRDHPKVRSELSAMEHQNFLFDIKGYIRRQLKCATSSARC